MHKKHRSGILVTLLIILALCPNTTFSISRKKNQNKSVIKKDKWVIKSEKIDYIEQRKKFFRWKTVKKINILYKIYDRKGRKLIHISRSQKDGSIQRKKIKRFINNKLVYEAEYGFKGKLKRKSIFKYNNKNFLIEAKYFYRNHLHQHSIVTNNKHFKYEVVFYYNRYTKKLTSKSLRKYNKENKLCANIHFNKNGDIDHRVLNKYDKKGRVILHKIYSRGNVLFKKVITTYAGLRRNKRIVLLLNNKRIVTGKNVYIYDSKSRMIEFLKYKQNNKFIQKSIFFFSNNKFVGKKTTNSKGNVIALFRYEYLKNGKIKSLVNIKNGNIARKQEWKYDINSRLVYSSYYNVSNDYTNTDKFTYDTKGNLVKKISETKEYVSIKRTIFTNGFKVVIDSTKRKGENIYKRKSIKKSLLSQTL
ncbi:MAG: hypothetical protein KAS64_01495, partial [Spirochaetes bacterium]|nr:hypothetical protein [Spirochaetota bacterium]